MNGKSDLFNYLYNPEEYEKHKEFDRKKKIYYGNELRLQIEENNTIKNREDINEIEDFPLITSNNKNNYLFKNNIEISKENPYNNDNNYHYSKKGINFGNPLFPNLPYIQNQNEFQHIDDANNMNNVNNNTYNNDLNLEKLFNNFIKQQIKTIDDYININNSEKTEKLFNSLETKNNKTKNNENKIKNIKKLQNQNYNFIKNKENLYQENLLLEKEKEKELELLKSESQKLKNKLEYFTTQENYDNNKIKELFNKIMNKKAIKYSSIQINNKEEKNKNISNNKINKSISDSNNLGNDSNDTSNNNSENIEKLDNNSKNDLNISHKNTTIKKVKNNKEIHRFLKKTSKTLINKNPPIQNHFFAFKNNSFNNNSDLNKSSKNEENINNEDSEKEENSSSLSIENNSNNEEKEEKKESKFILNKKKTKIPSFILSKSNNIMDLFTKDEKHRVEKFSVNFQHKNINDLFYNQHLKKKEEKSKKKNSKIFPFPVNQNFKAIKNINNEIKNKNKQIKKYFNNPKVFPFYRARSKSYKAKRANNKLSKNLDGNANNNNTNLKNQDKNSNNNTNQDFFSRNNSKTYTYSYNNEDNSDINSKINKRKNKRYFTGHFSQKKKHKLSMPDFSKEKISKMLGLESTNNIIKKNKTKINEKIQNPPKRKSSSFAKKNKSFTFEEKEIRIRKLSNFANKKTGNDLFTGANNLNANNPIISNKNLIYKKDISGEDDKLYKMIKNFENNVKERLIIEENKLKQNNNKNKINSMYLNNNINNNMNINMNFKNNILFRNNISNFGEVELIPKKYIFRCKKVIYPEIESEKIKEKEKLLFGKNNKYY